MEHGSSSAHGDPSVHLVSRWLPARPAAPRQARALVGSVCTGIGEEAAQTAALLASELVTNGILHGGARRGRGDGSILFTAVRRADRVLVEVLDDGGGFEPGPRDRDLLTPGGFGLQLVERLSDRWGVERVGGTRVWFELDLV